MIPQFVGLTFKERKNAILMLERDNEKWPMTLSPVAHDLVARPGAPFAQWRSREFVVQAFAVAGGVIRLSVNRTHVDPATMRWVDGITWDELQALKSQAGYGDREAVEVYPPDSNVVDVANIRHLWVLPSPLTFSWRNYGGKS